MIYIHRFGGQQDTRIWKERGDMLSKDDVSEQFLWLTPSESNTRWMRILSFPQTREKPLLEAIHQQEKAYQNIQCDGQDVLFMEIQD